MDAAEDEDELRARVAACRGEARDGDIEPLLDALEDLAEHLSEHGALHEARALLCEGETLLRLACGDARDEERRAYLASLLGRLDEARGDFAAAEAWFRQYVALRERLAAREASARNRSLLALARRGSGLFLLRRQRLDQAEAEFAAAQAICRELAATDAHPEHRRALATVADLLADVAAARGRSDLAAARFGEAVAIIDALLAGPPDADDDDAAEGPRRLVRTLGKLGSCLMRDGRLDEAAAAIGRVRSLLAAGGADPAQAEQIAQVDWKLAGLAHRRGSRELAEAHYAAAIDARERLAAAHDDVPSRRSLALLRCDSGLFCYVNEDPEGATEHLARARELWTDLVAVAPELRRWLIETVALQAMVATDTDPGASEALRRDALRMAGELVAERDDAESRMVLAQQHSLLAALCEDQGRFAEAETEYRRAHALWAELAAATGMRRHREDAARAGQDLGDAARGRGDFAAAMAWYERSVAARDRLAAEFGDARGVHAHAVALQHLADFLLDRSDAPRAAATAARASALLEALPQRHEDIDLQCALARCLCTEAEAAAALARFDDAEACYRRALALLDAAAPRTCDRWPTRQLAQLLTDFADFLQPRGAFAAAAAMRERAAALRSRVPPPS